MLSALSVHSSLLNPLHCAAADKPDGCSGRGTEVYMTLEDFVSPQFNCQQKYGYCLGVAVRLPFILVTLQIIETRLKGSVLRINFPISRRNKHSKAENSKNTKTNTQNHRQGFPQPGQRSRFPPPNAFTYAPFVLAVIPPQNQHVTVDCSPLFLSLYIEGVKSGTLHVFLRKKSSLLVYTIFKIPSTCIIL